MITTAHFKTLDDLYNFYNEALFGGELADCIVNMSRHSGSYGFFSPKRWKTDENGEPRLVHEISINPDHLDRPFEEWHSTFVHEMAHLWQEDCGHPSRIGYHNKEWAWKMEEIGLIPSHNGEPGGKKTGQNMMHYINPEGLFIKTFNRLTTETLEALKLKYLPAYTPHDKIRGREGGEGGGTLTPGGDDGNESGEGNTNRKKTSKTKYTCPCGNNVWGRPGLILTCGECQGNFQEEP